MDIEESSLHLNVHSTEEIEDDDQKIVNLNSHPMINELAG